jgi:hypothetical protein
MTLTKPVIPLPLARSRSSLLSISSGTGASCARVHHWRRVTFDSIASYSSKASVMDCPSFEEKRSIDDCDVFSRDWKRPRPNPTLAKRRGASRPCGRRLHRNLSATNTIDSESVLSSGIAYPNYEFTFSYKITPTRATDSSRAMQRQKYPAFRRPTGRPLMHLAYGVPLVAATYEAHRDLVVRLASANLLPGPSL